MDLNCYLIEPAENFIALLCNPISLYFNNNNEKSSLYMKWKFNFIELYNNKSEFLCMAHTELDEKVCEEQQILESNYYDNYLQVKQNFRFIANKINIWNNHILIDEDQFILNIEDLDDNPNNNELIFDLIKKENDNKRLIEIIF
mgnify:FL=1